MRWRKLGLVYVAQGEQSWAVSHAYIPTAWLLDESTIRVYVAFLDADRVGRVGYVDVRAQDPREVLAVSQDPVLDVGCPGAFDEAGVTPMCVLQQGDELFLYYTGWQRGVAVRYYLFTGLAISRDGGDSFERVSQAPILDRVDGELFVRSAPTVVRENGRWRMWYVGGDEWVDVQGKQVPSYRLLYAESNDGIHWSDRGRLCLDFANDDEFGFGRPFVLAGQQGYRMWYSIRTRSRGYPLGYAHSEDGLSWNRMDDRVGIGVSSSGWDSEMACFACVQPTRYGTYLFYNGNHYGETGFGVAVLQE